MIDGVPLPKAVTSIATENCAFAQSGVTVDEAIAAGAQEAATILIENLLFHRKMQNNTGLKVFVNHQ